MSRPGHERRDRSIAIAGFVALLALHLDFWRPQSAELLFGWLPVELAYRIGYCLLAWAYLMFVCARLWPERADP